MKFYLYFFVLKQSGSVHIPYIFLVGPGLLVQISSPVEGKTLTSAPAVATNWLPDVLSQINSRPSLRPDVKATTGTQPARFPTMHMISSTSGSSFQMCSDNYRTRYAFDNNINYQQQWVAWFWHSVPVVGLAGLHW